MTNINQKEYLKKYLKIGAKTGEKKKKKKSDKTSGTRMKIIDDDVDTILSKEIQDDIDAANEDAPQIVAVIDERPHSLIVDEKTKSSLWKPLGETSTSSEFKNFKIGSIKLNTHRDDLDKNKQVTSKSKPSKRSDLPSTSTYNNMSLRDGKYSYNETDYSPPRKGQDYSPPRKRDQSHSPPRIIDQDCSPKRKDKKDHEKDYSPPRRKHKDYSPPRKRNQTDSPSRKNCQDYSIQRKAKDHERDYSPPRRKDNDYSPPRKRIQSDSPPRNKDQDYSITRKEKDHEKDYSPPRRKDYSPPRKRNQSDSPSRKKDQDYSIQRKDKDHEKDYSPPRRKDKDYSPPRKKDKDYSPQRKGKDYSPQRKHKDSKFHVGTSKEQDYSPPRKKLKDPTSPSRRDTHSATRNKEQDQSLPRENHHSQREKYYSSPPKDKSRKKQSRWGREHSPASMELQKPETTMSGKKSGLQNAKNLVEDIARLQREEEELFKTMSTDVSGVNATTIVRKKKQEEVVDPEKEAREQELKKKYCVWGKGLKQVQDESERYAEQQREMSKPLARYADDEDLERYLKEQEREGDPMLAYIRKKKKKVAVEQGIPEKPMYMGDFMPNRFGIRPGYRWDGVDRSNGYEKKWFETQNAKKALQEEATKWSTEDM